MTDSKIALAMIVKGTGDEPKRLRRALESVVPFVDGAYVTLTGTPEEYKEAEVVCREFKVNVSRQQFLWTATQEAVDWLKNFLKYEPHMKVGDKIFLFDEARNYNFAQVPKDYEWILWMDCDDVLRRGENLWKLKDIGREAKVDSFFLNYIYQAEFDDKGKVKGSVIEHLRERVVRNDGSYKWVMPIHETLIETHPTQKTDNYDCDILHLAEHQDRLASMIRNLKNLELAIYKTKGEDPRQVYYLAKAYFDLATQGDKQYFDKAIPLIEQYLVGKHQSGWPEERAQACEYLAEIYRAKGENDKATWAALNALIEHPENPSIFLSLAATESLKGQWERALFWVKIASSFQEKKSTLVRNPKDIQLKTLEIIYNCCVQLGQVDEAWAAATKLLEMYPNDQQFVNSYNFINNVRTQREIVKGIIMLTDVLKQTNEQAKIKSLLDAVPQFAANNPFIADLYHKNFPPKTHDDKSVVIFCGQGFTTWSPQKMKKPGESFVGGSEEAVVCMSQELAKLGWKVTVYADPGEDEGEVDGVTWLPYYKFNKKNRFNILVIWRQIGLVDNDFTAKKLYIWCHDIQLPIDWHEDRWKKITKAMFLSKWHRENIKSLPEEKVFMTSNGV